MLRLGLRLGSPTTADELALLRAIQFDRAALQRLHEQRLTALLGHAWSTTEYYREVLSACGAVRNGVVDLARFEDIPFLTRDIVREQFGRLTSRSLPGGRKAYRNATGGSTGQPAQFLQDNVYWDVNIATKLFHFEWFGKRPGDRELKIWGAEHDLLKGREGLGSRLRNWLYNRRSEQCFFLPEDRVRQIIAHINRFRPDLIWAYRDGIDVIAQAINRQGLEMHRPRASSWAAAPSTRTSWKRWRRPSAPRRSTSMAAARPATSPASAPSAAACTSPSTRIGWRWSIPRPAPLRTAMRVSSRSRPCTTTPCR